MAMVGNLPHYVIDNELALSIFVSPNQAERPDHKGPFLVSWILAMLAQHCHRRIAGIAIQQRELKGKLEARVPRGVFLQLAQVTFGHNRKALQLRCAFGKLQTQVNDEPTEVPRRKSVYRVSSNSQLASGFSTPQGVSSILLPV
jgi:hypothetical protein